MSLDGYSTANGVTACPPDSLYRPSVYEAFFNLNEPLKASTFSESDLLVQTVASS